jgi:AraC-like DNA-binding protein
MRDANEIQARIAANVRAEIARAGLDPADVAEKLHMHPKSLRFRLNAEIGFSARQIVQLATLMQVSPAALIDVDTPVIVDRPRGSDPGVLGAEALPGG